MISPPHFLPFSLHIHDYPPMRWGGKPKMDGGATSPPNVAPPISRDPGGGIFCAPPSGFSWGGYFFMGGNSKWGEKGIYVWVVPGWELLVLVHRRDLRMLYLRVFSELHDKLSIWDHLRVLFCQLRASKVVCGTDRYQVIIKIQ